MKLACTYENGNIFGHFGHCEHFKIYEIENGEITQSVVVSTLGNGHSALAGFLQAAGVTALICGGIGGGAKQALAAANVTVYAGCSGNADEAVRALLNGSLVYNNNATCSHHHSHGEGHTCGEHSCGTCGGHNAHTCGGQLAH